MLEPPAVMKAMPRSSATIDDTPEFPLIMDATPEFTVVMSVAFGDNKAFPVHWRLTSSLADLPLMSRAAGIPGPSAVEVKEMVPLSAVLPVPVMAVAMLSVWVVHCSLTPDPSPVQVSGPKQSPVQESILKQSPVQESIPEPSPVQELIPEPCPVQLSGPKPSQVQKFVPEPNLVQVSVPEPSPVQESFKKL